MKKRAGYKLIALLLCFVLAVCGITAALTVGAIRFAYPMKYENYIENIRLSTMSRKRLCSRS